MSDLPEEATLTPGQPVMVRAGIISAVVNGRPPRVCWGVLQRRLDDGDTWWVDVYVGGAEPLPQMYAEAELLGVPAPGLRYEPVM